MTRPCSSLAVAVAVASTARATTRRAGYYSLQASEQGQKKFFFFKNCFLSGLRNFHVILLHFACAMLME
jgi:hypothetical protein